MELSLEQLRELMGYAARAGAQAACALIAGNMETIVRDTARAGAEALKREQKAIRKRENAEHIDRRLHNTRLLLKNYWMLKQHFQNAVYSFEEEANDTEIKPGDLWKLLNQTTPTDEIYIESICKSATRTMLIIQHVDRMLDIYAAACERSAMDSMKRQYRILQARYLDDSPLPMTEIAEREHIHRRTAEKDLDAAIEGLTALIFGFDAIKDLTKGEANP